MWRKRVLNTFCEKVDAIETLPDDMGRALAASALRREGCVQWQDHGHEQIYQRAMNKLHAMLGMKPWL